MRTTVRLSDELVAAAKRRGRERGQSLGEVIDAALRRELAIPATPAERPPLPVFRSGTGARPGIDLTSNRALSEVLEEPVDV